MKRKDKISKIKYPNLTQRILEVNDYTQKDTDPLSKAQIFALLGGIIKDLDATQEGEDS